MYKILGVAILALGMMGQAVAQNTAQANPSTFNTNRHMQTFGEEYYNRKIAEYTLQQINGGIRQIHDPYVVDFVYQLASQMNSAARTQSLLAIPIIWDNNINAFAVPGGLLGIHTGTILASQSVDEMASVIAHEIAHLSLRHYERNQDQKNKQIAMQIGGLLAALAVSAASGDGAALAMIGSQTAVAENSAAHSRAHEKEADRVGMQIMAQAGFDVHAMPRFFDTLQKQTALQLPKNAFIPSFMQSHPFSLERMSEATARAALYPKTPFASTQHQKQFDMLFWRVKYLSKQADIKALTHHAKTSAGAKLALIAALADVQDFTLAQQYMQDFVGEEDTPLVCITRAHIAYEQHDFAKAAQILAPCQAIYPERRDLALYWADSALHADQAIQAITTLHTLTQKNTHDIIAWQLLSKAYERAAKQTPQNSPDSALFSARSLQARAQYELWRGQYDKALVSLTQAKTFAKDSKALQRALAKDQQIVRDFKDFKP